MLRLGRALLFIALMSALSCAQEVTLSAHVKVLDAESKSESSHAENVVVWLTPMDGVPPPGQALKQPPRLVQHKKSFVPHVLVVRVGSVVQFPNHDPFFHNVFSLFEGKRFDLGLYEAGTTKNVSFDRPGISYIFCNIHAEMSAVVIAVDTPYFAVSNRKGEVILPQIPVGKYTMHVWHETAPQQSLDALAREVNVTESVSSLGVIQVPSGPVVSAHKNKYGMDYETPAPDSPAYERH